MAESLRVEKGDLMLYQIDARNNLNQLLERYS